MFKKIVIAIVILIGISFIALESVGISVGGIIFLEPISVNLQLKASPNKILLSKEVEKVVCNEWEDIDSTTTDGKVKKCKKTKIEKFISYDYISDMEVLMVEGEDMSKRTQNAQFFKKGKIGNEEFWQAIVFTGMPFHYDSTQKKWYKVKTATTTIGAFNKQMKVGWFDELLGRQAFAITTTTYSGAGDGSFHMTEEATWTAARDAPVAEYVQDSETWINVRADYRGGVIGYNCTRMFFPFYTDGIPAAATISSSTLHLYLSGVGTPNFLDTAIIQTSQASETGLVGADFNNLAYVAGSAEFDGDTFVVSAYNAFPLNATGLGWIKKEGESPNCGATNGWTCLGMIEKNDLDNQSPPDSGSAAYADAHSFEGANSPWLAIDYSIGVADTCSCPDPADDWTVNSGDNCHLTSVCYLAGYTLLIKDTGGDGFHILNGGDLTVGEIQTTSTQWTIEAGGEVNFRQ